MPLYFNATHLPATQSAYVAWVDVMGTQSSMSRSISVTANFIFKLHIAALQAARAGVRLYPVMDGFYASSRSQAEFLEFLRAVMTAVANEFNSAENQFRFLIRGGLAFGPVVHGVNIPPQVSTVLAGGGPYRDSILLGMPMVQAHMSETSAPPFGIYVHESARAFAPTGSDPLHVLWWRWDNGANAAIWAALKGTLTTYFDWCSSRSMRIGYAADRIAAHRQMADQYFA